MEPLPPGNAARAAAIDRVSAIELVFFIKNLL
jgi:hypothetical protein